MSARAGILVEHYDRAVEQLLATVGDLPDEVWTAICADLGWTVAATTQHIAYFMGDDLVWLAEAARGDQATVQSIEELHRNNAMNAIANAHADHDDTLATIELAHQRGRATIAALSDDQLAHAIPTDVFFPGDISSDPWVIEIIRQTGESIRLDALVEHVLIGHVELHIDSIKAAVNAVAQISGQSEESEGNTD